MLKYMRCGDFWLNLNAEPPEHKEIFIEGVKKMICPTCKSEIPDGSLICPSCQEEIETKKLREKCEATRKGWHDALGKEFHKPVFLILLISLAVVVFGEILSAIGVLKTSIPAFVVILIFCIAMAISLVASIKLYAKKQFDSKDMKGLTSMCSLMVFFCVMSTIAVSILAVLLVIAGIALASAVTNAGGSIGEIGSIAGDAASSAGGADIANQIEQIFGNLQSTLNVGAGVLVAIVVIVAVLLVAFFVNYTLTYSRAKKFYRSLMKSADSFVGQMQIVAPVKRLYFFGVITLIASIGVFATMGVTGIYTLGLAVYTFVTGLFFKDVAATYEANVAKLASEEAELKHAEEETAALRAKNKRIEEEKERARKAENDRLRDQQNAMFRQFMQQQMMNMQAGGATAPNAPDNAEPAAPAATADTVETKTNEATEGTTETTE